MSNSEKSSNDAERAALPWTHWDCWEFNSLYDKFPLHFSSNSKNTLNRRQYQQLSIWVVSLMMTQAFYHFPFQSFLLNEIVIRSVNNSPSHDKCQTPGYFSGSKREYITETHKFLLIMINKQDPRVHVWFQCKGYYVGYLAFCINWFF